MQVKYFAIFIIMALWLHACKNLKDKNVVRDTSITVVTSFNNLFTDSIQLENFIGSHPRYKKYEKQYIDFYKQRNYEYAWFDSSGLGEQAHNFINLLNNTISNLQDSSLYNKAVYAMYNKFIADDKKPKHYGEILQTELYLTGQFFHYAAKVYNGSDVDVSELGWFIPRKKVDLTALLDSVIQSKGKETDEYVSLNSQYKKLQDFLSIYFDLQKKDQWDSIPKPAKSIRPGEVSEIIPEIKNRLTILSDLTVNDSSATFDSSLLFAVKRFQKRMGLSPDGVIGARMINELNITPGKRIEQILINLERLRWMPAEQNNDYIYVNIPAFKMYVYENGKLNFSTNVIVGTAANNTVIFTGNLKYIVFSPYWNVPASIVEKEIIPALKKDTGYLTRHHMEITGYNNGMPMIRQKPGGDNSLGLVKFLFPNNYDIYFHDTPNRDLFTASSRNFSHGCIRVGEPKKLAEYLLRGDSSWNSAAIDSAMHLIDEKWVSLTHSVPVIICYFTAWVDKDGLLNFRKDIYGHDAKMADKLFVK